MKKPVQFGKYLLLDRINVGGMAEVFKAKAFGVEGFERLVAVKRILPNIAEDEEFITMFIDEAKIAVQLSHANIAQIFDLGKADDAFFIALEFVQGKDLRSIYDRCKGKPIDGSPAMPLAQACFIIMKACEGLDYAHNKKDQSGQELHLVHRDVSPQNILISYEGEVKLIDFGIAKAAGKASKTQQGILKGKFGYMSPEQVRGLPLDRRSDIFALGIVLYELLTAERLFVGESDFSTLEKVRNVEILPPSTYNRRIPEELERIVLKALAKDVEDRYQNAIDLHDDLQAFMYTAGEFYARKDLGAWMKRIYDEDIRSEQQKIESYQKLPALTAPPPVPITAPTAALIGQRRPSGGHAVLSPPPPPSQAIGQQRMTGQQAAVPPPRPPDDVHAHGGDAAPRTEQQNGKHANGHANGAHAKGEFGWDDEELATNIYDDKAEDAADSVVADIPAPARPDLSRVELSLDGAPVPARSPTPSRGMSPMALDQPPTRLTLTPNLGPASITGLPGPHQRAFGRGPSNAVLIGGCITIAACMVAVLGAYFYFGNRPGQIQLTSEPSNGVQILIDNQRVSADGTPALISRAPGTYSLTVQHEGYVPWTEQIDVRSHELTKKHAVLEPLTSGTGFKLSEPIGAQVYLDGKLLDGQTPLQVQSVMPGTHKVEVRGPYGSWVEDINLEAGKMADLHPVFQAAPSSLAPPAPSRAERLAERADRDRPTPEQLEPTHRVPQPIAPPAPIHSPSTLADLPRERPVHTPRHPVAAPTGDDGDDGDLAAVPSRNTEHAATRPAATGGGGGEGYLRIASKPWTTITVDGAEKGHTPQTQIKLSAGTHRVQLTNPQFNVRDSFSITIGAGQTETIQKNYLAKEPAADSD